MNKLVPEVLPGVVVDKRTVGFINAIFSKVPDCWKRVVPDGIKVVSSEKSLAFLQILQQIPRGVRAPGADYVEAQAILVDETIFVRFNGGDTKSFQYELLCVLAWSLCIDAKFINCLNQCVPNTDSMQNAERFVRAFPFFIGEKSRESLRVKNSKLYDCMRLLEEKVKKIF
jgi:hypothetical protein